MDFLVIFVHILYILFKKMFWYVHLAMAHKQNDDGCFCGRFGVLMSFLRRLKRFFLEITARRGDLTSVFQNGLEQLPRSFSFI